MIEEILNSLEKLDGDVYILRAERISHDQQEAITHAWARLNESIAGSPKLLLIIPDTLNLHKATEEEFDFSIALKLLRMDCKLQRASWDCTYTVYKNQQLLNINKTTGEEFRCELEQVDLLATDWRVVKGE